MKKVLLFSIISFLAACAQNPNQARNTYVRTAGNVVGLGNIGSCSTSSAQANVGQVYDQTANAYGFEDRVKAFLSATVDPTEVGTISSYPGDTTGVRFSGAIKLDSSGNVVVAQTNITISVYDSLVVQSQQDGSNQYGPIQIGFGQAASGNFNLQTGTGYVMFQDSYGSVRLDGTISASTFSGTVSFANTTSVTGSTGASGQIGQFSIARCAIVQ